MEWYPLHDGTWPFFKGFCLVPETYFLLSHLACCPDNQGAHRGRPWKFKTNGHPCCKIKWTSASSFTFTSRTHSIPICKRICKVKAPNCELRFMKKMILSRYKRENPGGTVQSLEKTNYSPRASKDCMLNRLGVKWMYSAKATCPPPPPKHQLWSSLTFSAWLAYSVWRTHEMLCWFRGMNHLVLLPSVANGSPASCFALGLMLLTLCMSRVADLKILKPFSSTHWP